MTRPLSTELRLPCLFIFFLSMVLNQSLVAAEIPGGEGTAWRSSQEGKLSLTGGIRFGKMQLSGRPGQVFRDATTVEFVAGVRLGRVVIDGYWQPTGARVTREFVRSSGYTSAFFDRMGFNVVGLDAGFSLLDRSGFRITPLFGLKWAWIRQQGWYHPNWDLNGNSGASSVVGLRLDFNLGRWGEVEDFSRTIHWAYFQIMVANLSFDNDEYGEGHAVGITVGYNVDWIIWK